MTYSGDGPVKTVLVMTIVILCTKMSDEHSSCVGVLWSLTKKDSTTPLLS